MINSRQPGASGSGVVNTQAWIREFLPTDVNALHAIVGDQAVTQTLSFSPKTVEQTRVMLEQVCERATVQPRTEYYLAVALRATNEAIGMVRLGLNPDGVSAELGYAINRQHWRRGYAEFAAQEMVRFGFNEVGLERINAAVGLDNAASLALLNKLGFARGPLVPDYLHKDGQSVARQVFTVVAPSQQASTSAQNLDRSTLSDRRLRATQPPQRSAKR